MERTLGRYWWLDGNVGGGNGNGQTSAGITQ